jgi:hypothetical protein
VEKQERMLLLHLVAHLHYILAHNPSQLFQPRWWIRHSRCQRPPTVGANGNGGTGSNGDLNLYGNASNRATTLAWAATAVLLYLEVPGNARGGYSRRRLVPISTALRVGHMALVVVELDHLAELATVVL